MYNDGKGSGLMNSEKTGSFIAELRKQKNMTQKELAKKLGVTDKAISRWETGRGYPDIEILPDLADVFSVSINELLNGKIQPKGQPIYIPYGNLEFVCNTAKANRKKQKKQFNIIVAVFLFMILLLFGIMVINGVKTYTEYMVGSNNCIIQSDYSYLMYYNKKYVPLDTGYIEKHQPSENGAYDCKIGEIAVDMAKIQDYGFIDRIFCEDRLYYIKGIANDDIVYLYTDYDLLSTQYYVKEDKFKYYSKILENANPINYCAQIEQKDYNSKDISLSDELVKAIREAENNKKNLTVDTSTNRSSGEEHIFIHAYENNMIFYQFKGELLYKNEEYYWYPYQGYPDYTSNPYQIDEKYYNELKELFSYMYQ